MAQSAIKARPAPLRGVASVLKGVRKYWYCYAMVSGTVVLVMLFSYYPAASAVYHSFTIWDGFRPAQWVGLQNYKEVFSSDTFGRAFRNMTLLTVWSVAIALTSPLFAAAVIYRLRSDRTRYFFQLVFVLPIVVPGLVTILVWRNFYDPNVGLLNAVLASVGLPGSTWLNSPRTALPSLMFMGFPWVYGVAMLVYLAGLQAIPYEIVEAAIMDGAGGLQRFFRIEAPLIIPQLRLVLILACIDSLKGFGMQLLVTSGGPSNATTVPAWELYQAAMLGSRYGYASSIGMILFVIIFVATLVNSTAIRSSIEYEAR